MGGEEVKFRRNALRIRDMAFMDPPLRVGGSILSPTSIRSPWVSAWQSVSKGSSFSKSWRTSWPIRPATLGKLLTHCDNDRAGAQKPTIGDFMGTLSKLFSSGSGVGSSGTGATGSSTKK
jgi:hypothetical protein